MLLAIDTATRMASLALYDEAKARFLAEETWYSANNHTIELMPRLVRMVEQQGLSPAELTGVAVSLGPGSFTGLRIGLGMAKGLALACKPRKRVVELESRDKAARTALAGPNRTSDQDPISSQVSDGWIERGLPLVGVPTLDVVAHPHMVRRLPIWAILQAGRNRICVGHYVYRRGRWRRQGPYRLTTLESLCDQVDEPSLFCGELTAQDAELIRQRLEQAATVASPASSLRRAAYLAELGWQRLARGDFDDPNTLSPIYLHHPTIDA